METPVVLIFFNRPETTRRVFEKIAAAKPRKLFLLTDGPRPGRPGEAEKCFACREIVSQIGWDCQVYRNYPESNIGIGKRQHTGLNWVFEQVDRTIIFEDDCEPHPSFFPFCEELLERYKDNPRIMHISGWFPLRLAYNGEIPGSYFFTRSLNGHGWATWKRAWQHYDFRIQKWPELSRTSWLENILGNPRMAEFMKGIFDRVYRQKGGANWDHQWNFAIWSQDGLGIMPACNMIHYIGFDDATNPFWQNRALFDQSATEMTFPLRHPEEIRRNTSVDFFIYDTFFNNRVARNPPAVPFKRKVKSAFKSILPLSEITFFNSVV